MSKKIGQKTEAIFMAELLKRDFVVLMPFGDNERYDYVIDLGGVFKRVQCKTGRLKNGSVTFELASYNWNTKERKGYKGQIDYFGVYCPENNKCYLVPIDKVGKRHKSLRVEQSKNNQTKNTEDGEQYEIDKIRL